MWFCIYRTFANSKHVLLNINQASSLKIGISLCLSFTLSKDENYFLQSRKYSEFSFILYPTGIFMIFLFCFDIFLSVGIVGIVWYCFTPGAKFPGKCPVKNEGVEWRGEDRTGPAKYSWGNSSLSRKTESWESFMDFVQVAKETGVVMDPWNELVD